MDLNQRSHSISMSNANIPSYYGNYMEFCQIRSNPIEQGQDPMVLLWEHSPSRFYGDCMDFCQICIAIP